MQIILLEKVLNVGQLGEVVKVKDGYARNFLIPQKRAARPKLLWPSLKHAVLNSKKPKPRMAAAALLLNSKVLVLELPSKAGVDGRLFGSITNADISDALKVQGFEVTKSQVRVVEGAVKNSVHIQLPLACSLM